MTWELKIVEKLFKEDAHTSGVWAFATVSNSSYMDFHVEYFFFVLVLFSFFLLLSTLSLFILFTNFFFCFYTIFFFWILILMAGISLFPSYFLLISLELSKLVCSTAHSSTKHHFGATKMISMHRINKTKTTI